MKTQFLKFSALLLAAVITTSANAQKKPAAQKSNTASGYTNIYSEDGGREEIKTRDNGKDYELTLENDKVVELYVNGDKIPESKFGDYNGVINRLKEQVRVDRIQAKKDQAQALLDQELVRRDQKQAEKDQLQVKLDQEKAEQDQVQAKLDQEQAAKDQVQAKLDIEKTSKLQADAMLDREQAEKHRLQAKLDQEQAMKYRAQALKDQKQAKEDQQLMKMMINDLIKDGIVPDEASLRKLTISPTEMAVNGKKMPDDVFKRYKARYSKLANGVLSYSNENNFKGIRMEKKSDQ